MAVIRTDPRPARVPGKRSRRRGPTVPTSGPSGPAAAPEAPAPDAPPAPQRSGHRRTILLAVAAVLLVVVPTALAGYRSAQQPNTYAAQADIVYTPAQVTDTDVVERELATQEQLLLNRTALSTAGEPVGLSASEVSDRVDVEALEGSDLIRVRVEDGDASVARRIAESLVTQYTDRVTDRATARLDAQRTAVDDRIAALDRRLIEIGDRIRQISAVGLILPPALESEQRGLESEAEVLRQEISSLQQESLRQNLTDPGAGMPTAEVLVPAAPLAEPVGPQPLRAAAGGALLGLLLAFLLLAFTRVRHPSGTRPTDPPAVTGG